MQTLKGSVRYRMPQTAAVSVEELNQVLLIVMMSNFCQKVTKKF